MNRRDRSKNRPRRVVLSGGPAAGKSAILEIVRRHLADEVAVIPESATILFSGGFPRRESRAAKEIVQRAIFDLQRSSEALFAATHPKLPHVCDRGGLDGAAYWSRGVADFVRAMNTTMSKELARYDAVIFLESTAFDKKTWPTDNPIRTETPEEARAIDRRLRRIWSAHPSFHFVPHARDFYEKVAVCLITLHKVLGVGRDLPTLS